MSRSVSDPPAEVGPLVDAVTRRLRRSGSPSPRLDAELLVGHAVGRDRAWLHAHPEAGLDTASLAALEGWVDRREAGEPIAYIRGYKEWLSLRIRTDPRALIPRPETELLAEAAIAEIASRLTTDDAHLREHPIVAWEVATGSGAVAEALALRFRAALSLGRLRLVASDLSPDALELAAENLQAGGVASLVTLQLADLLDPAGTALPRPDVVIANLPYVPSDEVPRLPVAASFEPRSALDGGPDGLEPMRRLLAELAARLAPAGTVLLEVGAGQAPTVHEAAEALEPPVAVDVLADLGGVERVVILRARS